jgi:uncharacterized protein (TIGR02588 family)
VSQSSSQGRSRAEWTSLGISLAIVLVLVGILTVEQLRGPGRDPRLTATVRREEVRREEVRQEGEAYYLPVEVTNEGDLAARDVRVRVTLGAPAGDAAAGAGEAEVAELLLDFVPGGGRAGGTAVFRQDPRRAGGPAAVVTSYVDP